MKSLLTIMLLAVFAATMTPALAQAKPGKGRTGKNIQNVQRRQMPKNGVKDPDHSALRETAGDCRAAERLMAAALPIYNGHRHRAMEINKVSMQVLRAAFAWTPNAPAKPSNVQQLLSHIGTGSEVPASKYSSSEVARSNELMQKALAKLQKAKADLSKVQSQMGGYVAEASQLIDLSIQEVNLALSTVGRP